MFCSTWHSDAKTLGITGEIDASCCEAFAELVLAHASPKEPLLLDLGHVTFMDSTAIGTLLDVAGELGDRFRLVCVSKEIGPIFRILGLDEVFVGVDIPPAAGSLR